jgi:ABC-type transport system involved in multi-copper enzyme maturation permease subunit
MFGGGVWPVVQRELRATARWRWGHWLRLGGALGGVIVFCSVSANVPFAELGTELFASVHVLLLFLICAVVPALTADCIARERREGTLGLLFLTPLTASGVVVGKILAQILRVLTVWLAVVPVLAIAFLFGGITWADMIGYLVIELCAGLLCLAAGVLASSLTESRAIAFIIAFLLMAAFVGGSNQYIHWSVQRSARRVIRPGFRRTASGTGFVVTSFSPAPPGARFQIAGGGAGMVVTRGGSAFPYLLPPPSILAEDLAIGSIVLLVAIRIAGFCVERSWQDKVPSRRRENWVRRCCTPLFSRWFARRMRRTLEWNPMAWLQQYSWKARLSKWGLCLLFVLLECAIIDPAGPDALAGMVDALLLVLAAAYTFAGVNSFLNDKRSGALELILVSPLSVKQIIFGRAWGLWKQFLPATLVLVASNILVHFMIPDGRYFGYYADAPWNDSWFWLKNLEIAAIFLMLPVFASCIALRAKNLFLASVLTWAAMLFGPAAGWLVFMPLQNPVASFFGVIVGQVGSAFLAYALVRRSLERRSYSF